MTIRHVWQISAGWLICLVLAACLTAAAVAGAGEPPPGERKLLVGTKAVPPFAMQDANGRWTGISIDLWQQIAAELDLTYEFQVTDLKGLLDGVAQGSLDLAVAAITVTDERERLLDFTHPFYTTGLGIAVTSKEHNPWLSVLKRLRPPQPDKSMPWCMTRPCCAIS